jgi:GDP-L-fucose synthase
MGKMIVTGAAGFVGRHLTHRLLDGGHEVHAVDSICPLTGAIDPDAGWPLFDPRDYGGFKFYREDCRDWFKRVRDIDFECAFHLAAVVGGRLVIENNPLAVADDLGIDAAFWQWASATRPGRSVCFSSSAAYPVKFQRHDGYTLLREGMIRFDTDIGMPDMSYGWAKLTSEYLARLAHEKYGLRTVSFRPFSGYGEDQDDAYPFPSICKRVLASRGAGVIDVWGTGAQMRDFIHIDDCVDGVLAMMDRIDDGDAVNLSTGIFTSFADFVRLAADLAGYHPQVRGLSDRPEGVFARAGDITKQSNLGFTAGISFRTGVARALEYFMR